MQLKKNGLPVNNLIFFQGCISGLVLWLRGHFLANFSHFFLALYIYIYICVCVCVCVCVCKIDKLSITDQSFARHILTILSVDEISLSMNVNCSKSDLSDKIKRYFYLAVSVRLYGCITWTLSKRLKEKQDGITKRRCVLFRTNPGSNTPQNSSCTATYLPSHKTYNKGVLGMRSTAG